MGGETQNMIAVSPEKLHSCIQGPRTLFYKGAPWTRDSATLINNGTCEDFWGLEDKIPILSFDLANPTPFCVGLEAYGAPGLQECWINETEVQAHVKNAR